MMRSFLSWVGGKSQLAATICHLMPEHICYVEPFAGAGWVLFRKERSKVEVLNDADSDLVRLYLCVKEHPDELLRQLDLMFSSREMFDVLLQQEGLTDIQRAARFFYVLKNAFGSKMEGTPVFGYGRRGPGRFNPASALKTIRAAHDRLSRVTVEHLDFTDILARYDSPDTLFYCDPPYYGVEHYRQAFSALDHVRLATALCETKGTWLLSYNDVPRIRELYADRPTYAVGLTYSLNVSAPTRARELLICKTPFDDALLDSAPRKLEVLTP